VAKRVVIVGAGVVGTTCAGRLSRDGHDVTVIERNEELAREIDERHDVRVVVGNGCALPVLYEAGIESADILLAVTDSDESNMITALTVGSNPDLDARVTKAIRVRGREYVQNLEELSKRLAKPILMINPDEVAARRILSLIEVPASVDVAPLLDGALKIVGFRIRGGSPLQGKTLRELPALFDGRPPLIPVIYRGEDVLLPTGDTDIRPQDLVYFTSLPDQPLPVDRILGYHPPRERKIVIGGGGDIARLVARMAQHTHSTTIIKRNRAEAEKLAIELPNTVVIRGNTMDDEILREADIDRASVFLAATNEEGTNIISAVLARKLVEREQPLRTIALVDHPSYVSVAEKMGVSSVVSPRLASVSAILKFVRGARFEEVASLPQEKVEVGVVEHKEDSRLAGKRIRDVRPEGVVIAAVKTPEGKVIVPGGDDKIPIGSRVVVFSRSKDVEKAARLFAPRGAR
jgi:trk system potassium uptake protein TrkA